MQITVRYSAVDGYKARPRTFKTLPAVRAYVDKMVGAGAEYGSSGMYAVSNDGIGKVTLVEVMDNDTGRRLDSLAAVMCQPTPDTTPAPDSETAGERYLETGVIDDGLRPRRAAGCTCSDYQLNFVGCDCDAER